MDTKVTDASGGEREAMTTNCQLMALSAARESGDTTTRTVHDFVSALGRAFARLNGSSFKDHPVRPVRTTSRRPGAGWSGQWVPSGVSVVSRASAKRSSYNKLQARRPALLHRSKGHDQSCCHGVEKEKVTLDRNRCPQPQPPSPVSGCSWDGDDAFWVVE
jgi:hypothetical protein